MKLERQNFRNGDYRIWLDEVPAGHGFAFNNVYVDFDAAGFTKGGSFKKDSDGEAGLLWLIEKHKDEIK